MARRWARPARRCRRFAGAIEKSAGGLPTSTAIACSSCARITPDVDLLRLRAFELRLGSDDVGLGDDAGLVLVLRDLERALIGLDRLIEQLLRSRPLTRSST